MSNFLTFEEDSGEIVFIRRDSISSFHPHYIRKFCYRVTATVGKESYVIHETPSLEEAKAWCREQIALIDRTPVTGPTPAKPTSTTGA